MTAILLKELREGLKWAALVLAGTSAGTILALRANDPAFYWPLVGSGVATASAAAGGLLLGILQVAFEAGRDRWAFLVHRPVSRTAIFLGKALAGLGLLFLATGLPLAAAASWCALSERWTAPFYLPMALPGAADLVAGAACYFAGMLIALRDARWYGSRVLALGPAIACTALAWAVPEVRQSVLAAGAGIAVTATAAWGTFVAGGTYGPQPRPAKVALGLSIFVGICLAAVAALAVLSGLLQEARPRGKSVHHALLRDGTILRVVEDERGRVAVTDLSGRTVEEQQYRSRPRAFLLGDLWLAGPGIDFIAPFGSRSPLRFLAPVGGRVARRALALLDPRAPRPGLRPLREAAHREPGARRLRPGRRRSAGAVPRGAPARPSEPRQGARPRRRRLGRRSRGEAGRARLLRRSGRRGGRRRGGTPRGPLPGGRGRDAEVDRPTRA
ncbi:MAG: hypothetical protein HY721_14300 [Planctomycetes bacterium]|nr:hypothetical protein [Planctomycetota bacterium]